MSSIIPLQTTRLQEELSERIFDSGFNFEKTALELFHIQSKYCAPYSKYISLLNISPENVTELSQIPFIPVSFYKSHEIKCFNGKAQKIFTSSSTTGQTPSIHFVKDTTLYEKSFMQSFKMFVGDPAEYNILALLPSYLEREGSSLVYMTNHLIDKSTKKNSGFYLYNHRELYETLLHLKLSNQKTILLGVTFALLDFLDKYKIYFPSLMVYETGGMKGRKKELIRDNVHEILKKGFEVNKIGSEYGMAELLSQAWSDGEGIFTPPPWMKILTRDLNNPFAFTKQGSLGGVNIIDLANIYSCSFIETMDTGIKEAGETFRITGRINHSEIRGCNLLLKD